MTDTKTLYEALANAQAEMKNAAFNRENTHFKSKYADMASVHDAVAPILGKHGIAYYQTDHVIETGPVCRTTLRKGADEIVSDTPIIVGGQTTVQAYFSARTYARRHGLSGIVGIASEDDDDGATAEKRGEVDRPGAPKNAKDENWRGPLLTGKLKTKMREYVDLLEVAGTMAELESIGETLGAQPSDIPKDYQFEWPAGMTWNQIIEQAEHDKPGWISGEGMPEQFIPINSHMDAALDRVGANGGEE